MNKVQERKNIKTNQSKVCKLIFFECPALPECMITFNKKYNQTIVP